VAPPVGQFAHRQGGVSNRRRSSDDEWGFGSPSNALESEPGRRGLSQGTPLAGIEESVCARAWATGGRLPRRRGRPAGTDHQAPSGGEASSRVSMSSGRRRGAQVVEWPEVARAFGPGQGQLFSLDNSGGALSSRGVASRAGGFVGRLGSAVWLRGWLISECWMASEPGNGGGEKGPRCSSFP